MRRSDRDDEMMMRMKVLTSLVGTHILVVDSRQHTNVLKWKSIDVEKEHQPR